MDHYAEDYETVIELAETHSNSSVVNSDTLQYFAIDVYAYDIAAPGVGCHGEEPEHHDASSISGSVVTATAVVTASAAATSSGPTLTSSEPATGTTTAPTVREWARSAHEQSANGSQECHTHADGAVHCS